MKRSRHVALTLLGAAAFGLAACQEEATEAASFADLDSCMAAASDGGWFTEADCKTTFAEAQVLHEETAPRYESRELCEEEHGVGNCGGDTVAGSGGGRSCTGHAGNGASGSESRARPFATRCASASSPDRTAPSSTAPTASFARWTNGTRRSA